MMKILTEENFLLYEKLKVNYIITMYADSRARYVCKQPHKVIAVVMHDCSNHTVHCMTVVLVCDLIQQVSVYVCKQPHKVIAVVMHDCSNHTVHCMTVVLVCDLIQQVFVYGMQWILCV